MNDQYKPTIEELNELAEVAAAIKRGEELHPGPFSVTEWDQALTEELEEMSAELYTGKIDFQRLHDELIDITVVAYRWACQIKDELNGQKK